MRFLISSMLRSCETHGACAEEVNMILHTNVQVI